MGETDPGVSYDVFLGAIWGFAALDLLCLAIRLYARYRGPHRLFSDDGFVILAFILVLTNAAIWQRTASTMYYVMDVTSGHAIPSADIFDKEKEWLRASLATDICFYTSLAAAKLSCIFFFRRLGHHIDSQRYLRWPALIVTLGTWVACIARVPYDCMVGSIEDINVRCAEPAAVHSAAVTVKVNCALDVFSDFLILLIPITLLWNVRMPLVRKLAFIGLFSLSIVTMVIAIFRAGGMDGTRLEDRQADPTFLWLWGAVESSVAVVIACISAFPQLFVRSKPVYKPSDTYIQRLKLRMLSKQQNHPTLYDLSTITPTTESECSYSRHAGLTPHEDRHCVPLPSTPKPAVLHCKSPFSISQNGDDHGATGGRASIQDV